jgi:carbamoylphosphate synthase small subunit
VVDEESLRGRSEAQITLRNLNDHSIEEIESQSLRMISTQYYPVSPSSDEVHGVFSRFLRMR